MTAKERVESLLRANQVRYSLLHHPLVYTADEVAAVEHVPGQDFAKVVMLKTADRLVMAVVPATHRVSLARAAAILRVPDVRLATEAEFANAIPESEVGATPPFGNLYGLPVYVDESLARDATITFRAGTHTDTITIDYPHYVQLVKPIVVSIGVRAD
jgi:Ala-tRNA(Pro) deacylase